MNEYILGNLVGISQTILGYPFDTLKTNIQNRHTIKPFLVRPLSLYTGVRYPMINSMIGTTFMFGNYNSLLEYTNNKLISASITGFLGAFIITPLDYFKIHRQSQLTHTNPHTNPYPYKSIIKSAYNGLWLTIIRESISIPAYFLTFDIMYYEWKMPAFFAGACAGVNSWFITYPIDTLKTRRQLFNNKSLKELLVMGRLYNGLGITLIRAVIVNGINFELYTLLKNNLANKKN